MSSCGGVLGGGADDLIEFGRNLARSGHDLGKRRACAVEFVAVAQTNSPDLDAGSSNPDVGDLPDSLKALAAHDDNLGSGGGAYISHPSYISHPWGRAGSAAVMAPGVKHPPPTKLYVAKCAYIVWVCKYMLLYVVLPQEKKTSYSLYLCPLLDFFLDGVLVISWKES